MDNNLSNHEYSETVSATSEDLLKLPDIVQILLEQYQQEKLDLGTQEQNKKDLELWFCSIMNNINGNLPTTILSLDSKYAVDVKDNGATAVFPIADGVESPSEFHVAII